MISVVIKGCWWCFKACCGLDGLEIEDSAFSNQGKVYPVSPHPRKKWQVTWEDTLEEEVVRIEESQKLTAGKHMVTRGGGRSGA